MELKKLNKEFTVCKVEDYSLVNLEETRSMRVISLCKGSNDISISLRERWKGGKTMEANTTLIRKVYMDCPLCDRMHEVEERKRFTTITLKGDEVTYEERFYFCANADEDENEFETGSMTNENLLNARNAYRVKHTAIQNPEI